MNYIKIINLVIFWQVFTCLQLQAVSVGTTPIGGVRTTLPTGVNLFSSVFTHEIAYIGKLSGVTSGATSTFTVANLTANVFSEQDFPTHYIEFTNDTDGTDGLDTEGLLLDIVSNGSDSVVVAVDASALGINGDERIIIRKHQTLFEYFSNATGITAYSDAVTLYTENGSESYAFSPPDWVNLSTFANANNVPIYPGQGIVLNNGAEVTMLNDGYVKTTSTQVPMYAASANVIALMHPLGNVDANVADFHDVLAPFGDTITTYSQDGAFTSEQYVSDGANTFYDLTTFQIATVHSAGENPLVVIVGSDTVLKIAPPLIIP